MNTISFGLHKVLQMCAVAKHHREHCDAECNVQLSILKQIAYDLRNRLSDRLEYEAATKAIEETNWF